MDYLIRDICMIGKEPNKITNTYMHNKNQTETKSQQNKNIGSYES